MGITKNDDSSKSVDRHLVSSSSLLDAQPKNDYSSNSVDGHLVSSSSSLDIRPRNDDSSKRVDGVLLSSTLSGHCKHQQSTLQSSATLTPYQSTQSHQYWNTDYNMPVRPPSLFTNFPMAQIPPHYQWYNSASLPNLHWSYSGNTQWLQTSMEANNNEEQKKWKSSKIKVDAPNEDNVIYPEHEAVDPNATNRYNYPSLETVQDKESLFNFLENAHDQDILKHSALYRLPIQKKDLTSLEPKTWLNDQVINALFENVMVQQMNSNIPRNRRTFIFQTGIMRKVTNGVAKYGILRAHKYSKYRDILQYAQLFFPINIRNTHWVSIYVNIADRTISYLDSLRHYDGREYLDMIHNFLNTMSKDEQDWQIITDIADAPLQINSYDCGIFTYFYGLHITEKRNLQFEFDQEQIDAAVDLRVGLIQKLLS